MGGRWTKLVFYSLLFSMILVLSIFESMLPPIFTSFQGVKPGISNIIVMYTIMLPNNKTDYRYTFVLVVLKSLFVFITRGYVAFIISMFGGILSVLVMIIFIIVFKDRVGLIGISVLGAVFHNIGQFLAVNLIYQTVIVYLLPQLLIFGVVFGVVSGVGLKVLKPRLERLKMLW